MQLERLTVKLLAAQDEERARIARELHDDFVQRVAALVLDIGALEQHPRSLPERTLSVLTPVREQLEQLANDLHDLAYTLHPSLLQHAGLHAAIEEHLSKLVQRTTLHVTFTVSGLPKGLCMETATCLFRVFQESLQNIVKHAEAAAVSIRLRGSTRGVGLSIIDNGKGFDRLDQRVQTVGLGLASMQERLRHANGVLRVSSRPAGGTTVCAWIPAKERTHDPPSHPYGG